MKQFRHLILIFLLISQARAGDPRGGNQPTEPGKFFREFVGLSDEQIRDVRSGKAIAYTSAATSRFRDEVFVFGTVYINSTPEQYLKLASDVERPSQSSRLPGATQIQRPAAARWPRWILFRG